jgi:hypothetical protein
VISLLGARTRGSEQRLLGAGLGIAYPAQELVVTDAATVLIAEDDLLKVAAKVLES